MKNPTMKLKLVCTFNAKFGHSLPGFKTRFIGAETRIISVDPTTLTLSNLRTLISQRFSVSTNNLILKYQLHGSQTGTGTDTSNDNEYDFEGTLVLLNSDDDVLCMVEKYERVVSCGNRFSRLWVFVFSGNYADTCEEKRFDGGLTKENLGLSGQNLGSKESLKKSLVGYSKNNVRRKKVRSDNVCLRKFVLKQQMLLAIQKDQIPNGYADSKIDANVRNYEQPLIDLRPDDADAGTLSTAKNDVNDSLSSDSCGKKSDSYGNLVDDGECFGVNSTLASNSCSSSVLDSNLTDEKNLKMMSSVGCSKACLNRENILLPSLHCNALSSDVCIGISSHCCCRIHQIRSRNVRDQRHGLSFNKRSRCVGKVGGKVSVGARSYSIKVIKQGDAMRFYLNSSLRSRSGLHRLSKARKLNESIQKQDNLSVEGSQVYLFGRGHPSIDLSKKCYEVKYKDNYDCEATTKCISDHDIALYMIPKNVERTSEDRTDTVNRTELVESGLTDSYGIPNGVTISIDPSSYNPSSSSSNIARPALSQLCSEDSASWWVTQIKVTGPVNDAKQLAETEGSNKTELNSVMDILTQWNRSLSLQEEIRDSPDDKVNSAKSKTYFNLIEGIPSDPAALRTQLATQGLQTIQGSDLEYIKELGSGKYGTVHHGKWKGSDVAIKKIKPSFSNGLAKEKNRLIADFWKEAQMLCRLHHPNIVAFYGIVTDGPITKLATVTEFMCSGSLKQVLQRKCRTIDQRKRLIIAMDAAFGMEYLHWKSIVHFDLKSHNFLLNMSDPLRPVCKIGDLGLSKIRQRTMLSGGIRGTISWMAPELLTNNTKLVSEKVDVYSFGIVMWELLTGEEPFADMCSKDIIAGVIEGTLRPEIPSWCEPSWRSLMERCWSSDPKSRPSFSEIAKELRAMSDSMSSSEEDASLAYNVS